MSTQRGILVGVDGSPAAAVAVDWAARAAASRQIALTLVHVLNPPLMMAWPEVAMPENFTSWQQEEGTRILETARGLAADAAGHDGGVQVLTEMPSGPTPQVLIDLSAGAEMIVTGSRGHGALGRAVFGSVSAQLVRHAHCPVAVVHDSDSPAPTPARAPVLLGIDGSPASERATALAFDEASRRGVELIALHAISDSDALRLPGVDYGNLEQSAHELLGERLAGWRERYPEVAVRREVVFSAPARALVQRSGEAQLVVVGSHGRGGFAGMLLGSVSSTVVQAVGAPVIVARQS